MSVISIGNDIVDLRVAEQGRHPRFYERVLAASEHATVAGGSNPWVLWAAKEAAYKTLKRLDSALVFSPVQFVVSVSNQTVTAYGDRSVVLHIDEQPEFVSVVAATEAGALAGARHWSREAAPNSSPSHEVRLYARKMIARELGVNADLISFSDPSAPKPGVSNAPTLFLSGEPSNHLVSFSHHGRFVACAFIRNHLELHS